MSKNGRRTPKVVLGVARDDMVLRDANIEPELLRLEIRLEPRGRVALKVRDIKTIRRQLEDVGEELP